MSRFIFLLILQCYNLPILLSQQNLETYSQKPNNTLPVQITSFTYSIDGNNVMLSWTCATQTNNAGFLIERKGADSIWISVDFVNGSGTTNIPESFWYIDTSLEVGTYFYRLKQYDSDGSWYVYNEVLQVTIMPPQKIGDSFVCLPKTILMLDNYPNPFNPETNIQFISSISGYGVLKVINLKGQEIIILYNGFVKSREVYSFRFFANGLSSGIYFVFLQVNENRIAHKVILLR